MCKWYCLYRQSPIIKTVKDKNNIYWAYSNSEWSNGNYTATWENDRWHFQGNGVSGAYVNLVFNNTTHAFDGTIDLTYEFNFMTKNLLGLYIVDNSGSRRLIQNVSSYNIEKHYKWNYTASTKTIIIYIDGEYYNTIDLSSSNLTTIGFQISDWQSDMDCTLHDFKLSKR